MKYDPQSTSSGTRHHRASIRLKGQDYSLAGAYFITLVAYRREMLFGKIKDGKIRLNRRGEIVQEEWFRSVMIRKEFRLYKMNSL